MAVDTVSGDVYIVGSTSSLAGIASAGAPQTSLQGLKDAFVAKFNGSGVRQWSTYYGGGGTASDDLDAGVAIAVNATTHDIYLAGNSNSPSGIATVGAHQPSNTGQRSAFLAKFNSSGIRQWGTYYGGTGSDDGDVVSGVAVDASTGHVYLSGSTTSESGIATADAQQPLLGGGRDGFIARFDAAGVRVWGTYFGDVGDELVTGIALGAPGEVRMVGRTNSDSDIATVGASSVQLSGSGDAFVTNFGETPPPPPANNNFGNSMDLGSPGSVLVQTTAAATKESGEPNHAGSAGGASVWFHWTAPVSGPVSLHTTGSKFDTLLAIYTGAAVNALTPVASNDNFAGLASKVTFNAVAGTSYRVAVDGVSGSAGTLRLNFAPPNDEFAGRISLGSATGVFSGTNVSASAEAGEPNHAFYTAAQSVWWTWVAPASGQYEFGVTSPNVFSVIGVYTGSAVNALTSVGTRLASDRVRVPVTAGASYHIAVDTPYEAPEPFTLTIDPPPAAPVNDNFANRLTFTGTSATAASNNTLATKEPGEPNHYGNPGGKSVWWKWIAPASGPVVIDTFGSVFDTLLAVYTGSAVNGLGVVAANDDYSGVQSRVAFNAVAQTTYQIAVDGYSGASGSIVLNLSLSPNGGSFGLWIESFPSLVGADRERLADPDNDGLPNEVEMVLGLNPTVGSLASGGDPNQANRPILSTTATTLVLTYTIDPAYVGVSYPGRQPVTVIGQVSTTLAPNQWANVMPILVGGNTYKIEVPFGSDPRKFLRLQITDPNVP